jgi:hypothetical protein
VLDPAACGLSVARCRSPCQAAGTQPCKVAAFLAADAWDRAAALAVSEDRGAGRACVVAACRRVARCALRTALELTLRFCADDGCNLMLLVLRQILIASAATCRPICCTITGQKVCLMVHYPKPSSSCRKQISGAYPNSRPHLKCNGWLQELTCLDLAIQPHGVLSCWPRSSQGPRTHGAGVPVPQSIVLLHELTCSQVRACVPHTTSSDQVSRTHRLLLRSL